MSTSERLLTISEAAERLRTPPSTLRYWRLRGDSGPASFRVGRRVVYRESAVESWLTAQEAAGRTRTTRPGAA